MRVSPVPPELRSATGRVIRPADRTLPGDVMSPVHNQAVCRHDTSHRTTLHDQLRGDVMSLVHTQAVCRHDTGPLDRTCNVMLPVYNKTECRHDTSLAGMVRENGPRTTLPLLLRGLVPERVPGLSDRVVRSVSQTIVDLQRVMLDYRAGRLHRPSPALHSRPLPAAVRAVCPLSALLTHCIAVVWQ